MYSVVPIHKFKLKGYKLKVINRSQLAKTIIQVDNFDNFLLVSNILVFIVRFIKLYP